VDVDDFYAADPARGASPEVRFGGAWLDEAGYGYAVGWVEDTGEVYALRHVLIDRLPPIVHPWVGLLPGGAEVEAEVFVLLTEPTRRRIDSLLHGWSDLQGRPGGFEELLRRLDKAGYPPPW
jgi:hypothetical protein